MEKNSNKRKKKIILTIVTFLLGAGLVLGGLALWSGGFNAGSALIIVGFISVVISFITFRKIKYYCTNCGAELVSTGRYHETVISKRLTPTPRPLCTNTLNTSTNALSAIQNA